MRTPWFKRVDRLVAVAVLGAVALVWAVVVSLDAFRIFVQELDDLGTGQYTFARAAVYVLLTVPRRVYEMFGYAAVIGALMGLGGLAASGELTALRAAGLSRLRICASVALGIGVLTAAVTLLGETAAPWAEGRAQALALASKTGDVALARGGTVWLRDGPRVIGARRAQGTARDTVQLDAVRIFEFDEAGRLTALSVADRAVHGQGDWTLQGLRRTVFEDSRARSSEQAEAAWASGLDPGVLALGVVSPRHLSLRDLARNAWYLERNGQDASALRSAFWMRVFYPVNIIVLVFCAMPFAFGALRSGGLSRRLFLGIVLALGFYFLQRAAVSIGTVYGVSPLLANLLPPLVLLSAAALYLHRRA